MRFNENTGFTYQEELLVKQFLEEYEASMFHETAVGNPITIGDVSPIEHTLDVTVKSDNKFNPITESGTLNGMNYIKRADNTYELTGTPDRNINIPLGKCPLEQGKTYHLSGCPTGGGWTSYVINMRFDGSSATDEGQGIATPVVKANQDAELVIFVKQGYKLDKAIFKPMVSEGKDIKPYMPYDAKLEGTKVSVSGKNLLDVSTHESGSQGLTVKNEGQTLVINGKLITPHNLRLSLGKLPIKPNETVTVSVKVLGGTVTVPAQQGQFVYIYGLWNNNNTKFMRDSAGTTKFGDRVFTGTAPDTIDDTYQVLLQLGTPGIEFKNYKIGIQIEVGNTSTPYEPYQKSVYTVSDDNKIYGVESISPNMVINANSGLLEVTYLADINKWLHKLREQLGE